MIPRARRDLPQRRGRQPPAAAVPFKIMLIAAIVSGLPSLAVAETIAQALARAYANNPQLNAQRAIVRQADEGMPQALSGYRPNVSANASVGREYTDIKQTIPPDSAIPDERRVICSQGAQHPTLGRRHRFPDIVQWAADRKSGAHGGEPGGYGARDAARHGAIGAAGRGDDLHGHLA